ncbi:trypsin-like peptidase domain-containing protein [Gordonia sp. zg691]|uniref:S1C family serine protease n=1 Tax=Gordonia jinghuaiqii TaxID=2758710 RepID=UPI0016626094|nr:trypsin-like peptidase domain-containing protein [Gordonia jinghuaiqii]MBD0863744.1 trypsin-like peptidase domain-containing protein [Gordonia jinghuaiqii]
MTDDPRSRDEDSTARNPEGADAQFAHRAEPPQTERLTPGQGRSHSPVSPSTAQVFGRPSGVRGSFATTASSHRAPEPLIADPDPVLAEAFGRPEGSTDTLQRDPLATYGQAEEPARPADPWRDPESPARLVEPALTTPSAAAPTQPGGKLGVRDILLGNRISWAALATLAVIALLIALVGGLMGRYTAEVAAPLTSDTVELSTDDTAGDTGPRSSVAEVARTVEKSVVAIDVRAAGAYATGSGFIIDKAGYILTNNHVISMAANDKNAKLEVVFFDRQRVPARIVGRDPKTDLAVLKVDNVKNPTVSVLGSSGDLQIGEEVIAFGSPLGLNRTVTSGIVSATDRAVALTPDAESDTDAVIDAIQTDAAINPGNSGGPLVNAEAKVVGINTAGRLGAGGGSIGLGFAIPIDEAKPVVESLIRNGKVNHAQIGVNASSVRNEKVLGAQVRNVVAGSPAERAGIRENDVITSFNKRTIESADELNVAIRTAKIGEEVPFQYWRAGRTFSGTITPASD